MIIRNGQMSQFDQAALAAFEREMVAHGKAFSPRLCEVIGDEQVLRVVRLGIKRASEYGFTKRGPVRLYIEIMFLRGSGFDTDPQFSELSGILRAPGDQMLRAEQVHQESSAYLENVAGPGGANTRRALRELLRVVRSPLTLFSGFEESMLQEMRRIFPEKSAYVGEKGLHTLIAGAVEEAHRYRFSNTRHWAMLVFMHCFFGHGCGDDPLYPWITRTLRDELTIDVAGRAERLQNKATTWLEQVVADDEKGKTR